MTQKERNTLVTIVIPVYNVECYLSRCLDSVVNQSYRNLEIILVDDCSLDNSPILCDTWAEKDSRIRVIHKKVNQGLGLARNTGMEHATGKYVFFIDSDDYVSLDTVATCVKEAEQTAAQIVCYGVSFVNEKGKIKGESIPATRQTFFEGADVKERFLPDLIAPDPNKRETPSLTMSACMAMFDMEAIRMWNWQFVSEREIISEDVYSLLNLYQFVERVSIVSEGLYFYCENSKSLSHSYREDRYEQIRHFYLETVKLCRNGKYTQETEKRLSLLFFLFSIAALKQEVNGYGNAWDQIRKIREIVSDEVLQTALAENRWRKVSVARRIFFAAMRNKLYGICWLLLKIKK